MDIAIDKIVPSKTNPRKTFAAQDHADLVASIKAKGVLYDLTVRRIHFAEIGGKKRATIPIDEDAERYELVDGERRLRAAKDAGLKVVPCVVKDLTDAEVRTAQLVSFDQKVDILPSERAAAYQAEYDAGRSVPEIAAAVGRSESFVRGVLKLANLSEDFLDAVDSGFVPRATAELVARVPGEKARKTVELCVLQHSYHSNQMSTRAGRGQEALSFRDTRSLIQTEFQVELKGAPFPAKAPNLVPAAGSCEACPKRAGNAKKDDPDLKDTRDDVCLDPACYRTKCEAYQKQQAEAVKADGFKVLPPKEAEKLWPYGNHLADSAPYFDLADQCYSDTKAKRPRSYKQLVGEQLADQVVVAFDQEGRRHNLVPKAAAIKVLKEEHGLLSAGATSADTGRWKAQDAARRKKAEAGKRAATAANGLVAGMLERAFASAANLPHDTPALLQQLVFALAEHSWADAAKMVCRRRGLDTSNYQKAIRWVAADLAVPALMGLLAELVAARTSQFWGASYSTGDMSANDKAFWSAFEVDRAKLVREAEAERAAKKPAKHKPSANGKPAAKGAKAKAGV